MSKSRALAPIGAIVIIIGTLASAASAGTHSVAREWNDQLLDSIRLDFARPTVHARNLFHTSIVTWDAWAAYEPAADQYLTQEKMIAKDVEAARREAISFACYRLLVHRFSGSPGAPTMLPSYIAKFNELALLHGFQEDLTFISTVGNTPAAFGNRVAANMIAYGLADGSNEANDYANLYYDDINPFIFPDLPGNPDIIDPNRWQRIALDFFVDQSGNPFPIGEVPEFLGPEWGLVDAFALTDEDLTIYNRDGDDYWVFHDPGPPPSIDGLGGVDDQRYKDGFAQVVVWSSHLDPADNVMWDISPASWGNAPIPTAGDEAAYYDYLNGGDWGTGYTLNPVTLAPYTPQVVPRADFARCLAEFWADGPDSETPPGHWFTILNEVSDTITSKQLGGTGPVLTDLEWDVKTYLAMGGAMHDSAVAAWGVKGWYDYLRPISAIRYMADQGQSSDIFGPSYDPNGIPLVADVIEVVTLATTAAGQKHEDLAGEEGKIAIYAWRGPDFIANPETDVAGCGWILAENWWPYQRPTFVTPPFAGYVSGHSTFSRAAALVMTDLTGSPYFPGGLGEFPAPMNEFLVFEEGPSVNITLQFASYIDAADQSALSRIWGGIHPPADDLPGRAIGSEVAADATKLAKQYYAGVANCRSDLTNDEITGFSDLTTLLNQWGTANFAADIDCDGMVGFSDLTTLLNNWGPCPVTPLP